MASSQPLELRRTRRSPSGAWPFVALVIVTALLLAFEVVRANHSQYTRAHEWPWNIVLLGIPTTASLFTAGLTMWVVRDQFARTVRPGLRYVSRWVDSSADGLAPAGRYWHGTIKNAGPGPGTVVALRWRLETAAGVASEPAGLGDVRELLRALDLLDARDYGIANYSPGTVLTAGEERAYFECTPATVDALRRFEVVFELESMLGDRYERVVSLLPRPDASAGVTRSQPPNT
jgi:hypothetical protein